MAESKEELSLKEESEKAGLKLKTYQNEIHGILSLHFMAKRWEKMETVTDFILGSKITAVTAAIKLKGICSSEGKL